MATVTIEHVGPIERLEIPIPEDGGVVVLSGRNGSGKSHALRATETLLTGRSGGSLETRDGEPVGAVAGFGAKITVGKRARRSGQLEVVHLESRLDPSQLVDPGLKDPEAADSRRIKALITLAGVEPELAAFYEAFGDKKQFDEAVKPTSTAGNDLVEIAGRVKRDAEAKAREHEAWAESQRNKAQTYREQAAGIDIERCCDRDALAAELEAAIRECGELEGRATTARENRQAAEDAKKRLTEAVADYEGPSVVAAADKLDATRNARQVAEDNLRAAQRALDAAIRDVQLAEQTLRDARQHARMVAGWEETIQKAESISAPDEAQVSAAHQRRDLARQAVLDGQQIRDAKAQLDSAHVCIEEANRHQHAAGRFRDAAAGIDGILSKAVQKAGIPELRVSAGRLVTETRRGATLYSDLSHGERWRIALEIAIRQVGDGGLLVIPQEAWEGLDPDNRAAIAEQVEQHGVVVLTAEATDGELAASIMD